MQANTQTKHTNKHNIRTEQKKKKKKGDEENKRKKKNDKKKQNTGTAKEQITPEEPEQETPRDYFLRFGTNVYIQQVDRRNYNCSRRNLAGRQKRPLDVCALP